MRSGLWRSGPGKLTAQTEEPEQPGDLESDQLTEGPDGPPISAALSHGLASQLPLLASFQTATPTDHSSWRYRLTEIEEAESKMYFHVLKA